LSSELWKDETALAETSKSLSFIFLLVLTVNKELTVTQIRAEIAMIPFKYTTSSPPLCQMMLKTLTATRQGF
jgi:hypothetical protein